MGENILENDPMEILLRSTKIISPTLIQYDIGSLFEGILFNCLKKAKSQFDKIILVSFYDSYHILYHYWGSIFSIDEANKLMKGVEIITVYGKYPIEPKAGVRILDVEMTRLAPTIIDIINKNKGKSFLMVITGLDLYAIDRGEETFRKTYPLLMILSKQFKEVNIIVALNKNLISPKTLEFVGNYSFNIADLKVNASNEKISYYMLFKRIAMLEYNLKSWEYIVTERSIDFKERYNNKK
ncbi:MAG: hypothetical protein ACP6IS_08245 [Candidatus Asgardarchaeia archaeon]